MKKSIFILLMAGLFFAPVFGQEEKKPVNFCGYSGFDPWLEQYLNQKDEQPQVAGGAVLEVPMTVHIVGSDRGFSYYPVNRTLDALCQLNHDYEPSEIRFFLSRYFNYIPNSAWDQHEDFSGGAEMMSLNNFGGCVNLYIVGDPAGNCGYYSPGEDGIAVARNCSGTGDHTWAHEVGHFLSLPHTFSGWENAEDVNYNEPAPAYIRGRLVEKADSSNCRQAGDRFCDTPADYLNFRWNCDGNSQSQQAQLDPDSVKFRSDGTFFMSYSNDACTGRFSGEQTTAMRSNLTNRRGSFFNTKLNQDPIDPTQPIVLTSPLSGETLTGTSALLTWEPVPNATHYFVEVAYFRNFGLIAETGVTDKPEFLTTKLLPGREHFWRIRPFSESYFCKYQSQPDSFMVEKTTTGVEDLTGVGQLEIFPNPQAAGNSVSIQFYAENPMQLSATVYSVTGQILSSENFSAVSGENQLSILPPFEKGLYLLTLENAGGRIFRKLVIE